MRSGAYTTHCQIGFNKFMSFYTPKAGKGSHLPLLLKVLAGLLVGKGPLFLLDFSFLYYKLTNHFNKILIEMLYSVPCSIKKHFGG